jgi:hypothetical protein
MYLGNDGAAARHPLESGRLLSRLVIVGGATPEAVAVGSQHAIGGDHLAHTPNQFWSLMARPHLVRSDNGT